MHRMITKASWTAESWHRLTRWGVGACLLLLALGWPSPALAATSTWWDCNYKFRRKITITAGSTSVPSGYSVQLTFDHAALVSAGKSQANGNDIRIVYWNGSAWVQLDRVLDIPDEDDGSSWNNASTRIWFQTQTSSNANAPNDNYYLYYGNASAASPPANPLNVFLFHDDFPGSSINTSKWTVTRGSVSVASGQLTLNANSSIRATSSYAFGTNTRWEARVQLTGDGTVQYFNYWVASDQDGFSGEWIRFRTTSSAHLAETDTTATTTTTFTASTPTSFHTYAFERRGSSSVRFFQDTSQVASHTTNIPTVNLRPFAWSENGTNTQIYDWVRVRRFVNPEPTTTLGAEEIPFPYSFTPDAAAAGMHVPVTIVGSFCGTPTVTTSSSDIIVGPSILTDSTGAVVASNGSALSTLVFVKPDARPTTGITVSLNGTPLSQTFAIVTPAPDPNITSGSGSLGGRTTRGTAVLGGLTVGSGATLTISTSDTDGGTAGNQGYLPAVILVKGDVNIAGTLDVKGQDGANAGASGSGGQGGTGGPGGGGGGAGGLKTGTSGVGPPGGPGFSGGGGGGSNGTGTGGVGGDGSAAVGSAASGTVGGDGGIALGGGGGGGGGKTRGTSAGNGGGGGTGSPFGSGGWGGITDDTGGPGGQGGGGGGAAGTGPGGGAGGSFATAGTDGGGTEKGFGGTIYGNAQLVPLSGGSGGGGGGPDTDLTPSVAGGGGGGGGAILLYATGSVNITGTITAQGGIGGNGYISGTDASAAGGGGSGGAILLQSGKVTASGTLTTAGGAGGTSSSSSRAGGAGGSGRIRMDGLAAGATVPGTAGSKYIGPVIDTLVDQTVKGRANGGSTVTLYVYDGTGSQVTGSPYTTTASSTSGTVGTWTINNVTFPSGTGYLAVKQTSGTVQVFGPGRASKGLHLTNWREVY